MVVQHPPPLYLVYTLRCWEERGRDVHSAPEWRFTLLDAQTGERHGFGKLGQLAAYLDDRMKKQVEIQAVRKH